MYKRGNVYAGISCVGECDYFSLFRLSFSPKASLNIHSLRSMLSLILKTTWAVFQVTFVNFLQAYKGFHFELQSSWRFIRPLELKK